MARISSKLSPTHPSYCAAFNPPSWDTLNHYVMTNASGAAAAVVAVPPTADSDSKRFGVYVRGRIKLYSGVTPGNFNLTIQQNNATPQVVKTFTLALPASAAGTILPFAVRIEGFYDNQAQSLRVFADGILGNSANNTIVTPTGVILATAVAPKDLSFSAYYSFSVAPQSGTTVDIREFLL